MSVENKEHDHFLEVWSNMGLWHSFWWYIIPGNTPKKVRDILYSIPNRTPKWYMSTRVCDAVSGNLVELILWAPYAWRLSTIEEDIFRQTDYVIHWPNWVLQIDFTQWNMGYSQKIWRKNRGQNHIIVQVSGAMLHGYIRQISAELKRDTSRTSRDIVAKLYKKHSKTIDVNFIQNMSDITHLSPR
jgi:hypothetical protein